MAARLCSDAPQEHCRVFGEDLQANSLILICVIKPCQQETRQLLSRLFGDCVSTLLAYKKKRKQSKTHFHSLIILGTLERFHREEEERSSALRVNWKR